MKLSERIEKQIRLMEDSICVYLLISTRGPNREEAYEKILKERTEEMLSDGYTVDSKCRTTFYPPKKS
jgi:hypothetical protein